MNKTHKKKKWYDIKGTCKNITDKSVVLKTNIVNKNDKNINISLILENTKVFKAALIVYTRVE
jgi:hypothetical protein